MQNDNLSTKNLWNKELLLERIMNNHEIFLTLLTIFIDDIPKLLEKINHAILKEDYEEIKSLAHNLKGSAYNLTADSVGDIAKDIELACKENRMDLIQLAKAELEVQIALTINLFKKELLNNN